MNAIESNERVTRIIAQERAYHRQDTGELAFFRYEYERPPKPEGLSKDHPIGFVHWHGGATVGVITECRRGKWLNAMQLLKPKTVHDCSIFYQVIVGKGERTLMNVDEAFYFVALPPEIATSRTEKEKLEKLVQWVMDVIVHEGKEFQVKAAKNRHDELVASPARLPYESSDIDHYKNQYEVALKLLRKNWPRLSQAMDNVAAANTEQDRHKRQAEVCLAYIADYTAIHGTRPVVDEKEESALWREDLLIRLLNEALSAPRGLVDKRDWQLANGWIVKNYYRMDERQLEEAFVRDWGYKRKTKGNTLAKRARRIGLFSALKRGRPEIHKFNDI